MMTPVLLPQTIPGFSFKNGIFKQDYILEDAPFIRRKI